MLPTFTHMVDSALETNTNLLTLIKAAAASAYPSITDSDVARFRKLFEDEVIHLTYYARQLDVWRQLKLTPAQITEIDRLDALLAPITKLATEGLTLTGDIRQRKHTYEGFIGKSDEELGLEFVLRMMKP